MADGDLLDVEDVGPAIRQEPISPAVMPGRSRPLRCSRIVPSTSADRRRSRSPQGPSSVASKISLQDGHTGKLSGLRLGIHFLPHRAITGTPSTALRTMSALRT